MRGMGRQRASVGRGLETSLIEIVGDRTARALDSGFGYRTARDLLLHAPRRLVERGELTALTDLRDGELVTVMARVRQAKAKPMTRRKGTLLEVVVGDQRNELKLTFFNQAWRSRILLPGRVGLFAGQVSSFRGRLQLTNPNYLLLPDGAQSEDGPSDVIGPGSDQVQGNDEVEAAAAFAGGWIPVYPATAALPSWRIQRMVGLVLEHLDWDTVVDPFGSAVGNDGKLPGLAEAFNSLHRPRDPGEFERARKRFRRDEALALQLVLAGRRELLRGEAAVRRPVRTDGLLAALDRRLPFELTVGQRRLGEQISSELDRDGPMQRLLQGDVGSGKTVVALRVMLQVVDSGGQAALLAPTEVLAGQHWRGLRDLLGPLADRGLLGGNDTGTRLALLTGSMPAAERRRALAEIASGESGIVIGTHALLQDSVRFRDLGLVVVDEQHRFGVRQRAALSERGDGGSRPHLLVMTATPIPRTVAMTVFGELETSTLTESPAGRAGVVSYPVEVGRNPRHEARVWERIREEVAQGRQAYVVCPQIGAGEDEVAGGPVQGSIPTNVTELVDFLATGPLAGLRLARLHGQLPPDEKERVMRAFAAGPVAVDAIDVLVSTTVIEVGVDVANATVMVIVGADRFGTSQLHQLRGRVGGGVHPGLCLMLTDAAPESRSLARVRAVAAEPDGFRLAEIDLGDRGEGDVLGADQSGRRSSLRMLSLQRDERIIVDARKVAGDLVRGDPNLERHPELADQLRRLLPEEAGEWLGRA